MTDQPASPRPRPLPPAVLGLLALFGLFFLGCVIWAGIVAITPPDPNRARWLLENFGQFGDAMAPVTSMFTLASLVAVVVGLVMQQRGATEQAGIQAKTLAAQEALVAKQAELVAAQQAMAGALSLAVSAWEAASKAQHEATRESRDALAADRREADARAIAELRAEAIRLGGEADRLIDGWRDIGRRVAQNNPPGHSGAARLREDLAALEAFASEHRQPLRAAVDTLEWMARVSMADPPIFSRSEVARLREVIARASAYMNELRERFACWR